MKRLIIINGTMGVGKTTASRILQKKLDNCVFLDGDWCWDSHPFIVTENTTTMVVQNIRYLLNNFLLCEEYQNVIFCWVMHEQRIIDSVMEDLDIKQCEVFFFSLVCSEEALVDRLSNDVRRGLRDISVIERSVSRIEKYRCLQTIKIDTSDMSANQTCDTILSLLN